MLWTDILWMFYSGMVGGSICSIMNRKSNKEFIEIMEEDIWRLKRTVALVNDKLSTLSVSNHVNNHNKSSKYKGNKSERSFNQRA